MTARKTCRVAGSYTVKNFWQKKEEKNGGGEEYTKCALSYANLITRSKISRIYSKMCIKHLPFPPALIGSTPSSPAKHKESCQQYLWAHNFGTYGFGVHNLRVATGSTYIHIIYILKRLFIVQRTASRPTWLCTEHTPHQTGNNKHNKIKKLRRYSGRTTLTAPHTPNNTPPNSSRDFKHTTKPKKRPTTKPKPNQPKPKQRHAITIV